MGGYILANRKGKSCRNHIWIINGINHEQNSSKKHAQLVLQSYDYTQMYDSMCLDTTISDLYDCGVKDDLLVLLYELNRNVTISVNTCYGLTENFSVTELIAQGDLIAPLMAAVQVDSLTRKLEEEDKERTEKGQPGLLHKYKDIVPIPSLGLMDDNLTISEAGYKAEQINTFMNVNSAEKKLQFNTKKCSFVSIGKNKSTAPSNTLEVDSWDITYDKDDNLIETEGDKVTMKEVSQMKYLGFIISENGSNVANILDKKHKSINTIRSIMGLTSGLKTHTFVNGLIYLNSLLRSKVLYGAETYYNLTERNLRMMEGIEEDCLRQLLETGKNCPISILYLDTGHLPARFQIKIMMLHFLKYILKQRKNTLLYRFFEAQCENPTKGDWVSNMKKCISDLEINKTFEDIKIMKKHMFKNMVSQKVRKTAFKYLILRIKSKGKEINYETNLKCQKYLMPNKILTVQEQRQIFSYRSRMNNLKHNFKSNKITELCECKTQMTNIHLYECKVLNSLEKIYTFDRLYNGTLKEQKYIVNILLENEDKFELFTQAQDGNLSSH